MLSGKISIGHYHHRNEHRILNQESKNHLDHQRASNLVLAMYSTCVSMTLSPFLIPPYLFMEVPFQYSCLGTMLKGNSLDLGQVGLGEGTGFP